jgi:hypothetical protein
MQKVHKTHDNMKIETLVEATKVQLDSLYPLPVGKGARSLEFISECLHGKHIDTHDYSLVLLAAYLARKVLSVSQAKLEIQPTTK